MKNKTITSREIRGWVLAPLLLLVLALGWKYPYLGYLAPVTMFAGLGTSFFKGRYICGNYCPRGAFFDRVMDKITLKRPIPSFFKTVTFRYSIAAILMSALAWRVSQDPTNPEYIGLVFWQMCLVTSVAGIALAIAYKPRTWCSFCPMGTIESAIGGHKQPLTSKTEGCKACGLCEKVCPMELKIIRDVKTGTITNPDCIKCGKCMRACPVGILKPE